MSAPRILAVCRLAQDVANDIPEAGRSPAEAGFMALFGPHMGSVSAIAEIAQEEMGAHAVRLLQEGAVE